MPDLMLKLKEVFVVFRKFKHFYFLPSDMDAILSSLHAVWRCVDWSVASVNFSQKAEKQ